LDYCIRFISADQKINSHGVNIFLKYACEPSASGRAAFASHSIRYQATIRNDSRQPDPFIMAAILFPFAVMVSVGVYSWWIHQNTVFIKAGEKQCQNYQKSKPFAER
jgi:hypothetical protein